MFKKLIESLFGANPSDLSCGGAIPPKYRW